MTQNQNFLILGYNGLLSFKIFGLGFGTQRCYSSQKSAPPGVQKSTMLSSNSGRTFVDSIICIELFGSELKAHFFKFVWFQNLSALLKLNSHCSVS